MGKQFKYSIVMAVYNVEAYIEEAVDSVLRQTIGFDDSIQIVFVNDGSTDESGRICKEYAARYPENIVYVEQENGGQSAARNAGICYATAPYINFFDPDDIFSDNVFEEVDAFFAKFGSFIDFVTIPLVYFEAETGLHGKYKPLGKKNRIVNLIESPNCFVLSCAGSFYKRKVLDGHSFDESLVTAEDMEFNAELMQENPQFGYVCENGVEYRYRRRRAGGSNVDKVRTGADTRPWSGICGAFDKAFGSRETLRDCEKEIVGYELRSRLRDLKKEYFEDPKDYDALLDDYARWISRLDDDFIINRSYYIDSKERKELFLRLKNQSFSKCVKNGTYGMHSFRVWVKDIKVNSDSVDLDILFARLGCPFDVIMLSEDGAVVEPVESFDLNSPFDFNVGEFAIDDTHYRKFSIPAKAGKYKLFFRNVEQNLLCEVSRISMPGKPPLMSTGESLGLLRGGKKYYFNENQFTIEQVKSGWFANGIKSIISLRREGKPWAIFRPFAREKKKYVLISDRPSKAGDNGQALYEHIMSGSNDKLKKVTYYVLDKKCPDYKSAVYKSHIIHPRSIRHKIKFLNARMLYSSHNAKHFYMPFSNNSKYYADLLDYTFVWLQHGVTMNDIAKQANRLATEDDFVVTNTADERAEILKPSYFYTPDQVLLTGMPRYDKLQNRPRKLITIAPTWRGSLSGKILKTGYHEPLSGFTDSRYYIEYSSLLTSDAFLDLLEKHDFECQFVLHPGVACYEDDFRRCASDRVRIVHQKDVVYADVFAESSIFVTDYSSTNFDFAYLCKPLVYFQFDEAAFFSGNYKSGYFDYRKNGFGPVETTVEGVLSSVEDIFNRDCVISDEYRQRVDTFFKEARSGCCQNVLDATLPDNLRA